VAASFTFGEQPVHRHRDEVVGVFFVRFFCAASVVDDGIVVTENIFKKK
jgi:hypothetical protein